MGAIAVTLRKPTG